MATISAGSVRSSVGPAPLPSYADRVLATQPASLIAYWRQSEASGSTALDASPSGRNASYSAGGVMLGVAGIGDGGTAARYDGNNSHVLIGTAAVAAAFDGNQGSALVWARNLGTWGADSTFRYPFHVRSASDATYYIVMGKSSTAGTLEWRRRTGGPIVSLTTAYTGGDDGLAWFSMGITWSYSATPGASFLRAYLNGARVGESTSASLTDFTPGGTVEGGTTVLYAGSTTLQEWVGDGAHAAIWGAALSDAEMAALGAL